MISCPKCRGFCEMDYEKNACLCTRSGADVAPPKLQEIRRRRPLIDV